MPRKNIWDSPPNVERAPLSATNDHDDDEEGKFVPYSDIPPHPSLKNGNENQRVGNGSSGKKYGNGPTSRAIMIEEDDGPSRGRTRNNSDEYAGRFASYEDEYGDLSYSNRMFDKELNRRHYRSSLVCAYLRYCCGNTLLKRLCRVLFFLALLLIMVFCASAIGYIIAQDGNPFGFDGIVSADSGKSNGRVPKLTPPPANLHNICSDWVTKTGRQTCQSYCDNAACCSLPETDKDSCWKENADDCATYRSGCMALELHSSVGQGKAEDVVSNAANVASSGSGIGSLSPKVNLPPPPDDLVDICSSNSLATPDGFNKCSDACRPSRCCNPYLYECELENEVSRSFCPSYEGPCKNVAETWRGSGHGVAGADDSTSVANQVMKRCNADNLNPPDFCIEACSQGSCCYVSSSYPPIEQLFDKYYGVDKNPIKTAASCTANIGFCQQYGSCEHLNRLQDTSGWHSDDTNYKLQIGSVCMAEYIAKNGALECSNVCQPAHCCFSQEYTCGDTTLGDFNCDNYAQCQILYPTKQNVGELLQLAEHIDEVCSDAVDSLVARSECQDQCKGHLCCFDDGAYGCSNDGSQNCLAYAGCEILVDTPQSALQVGNTGNNDIDSAASKPLEQNPDRVSSTQTTSSVTGATKSDIVTPSFVELNEVCNGKYLMANGVESCELLCKPFECCFGGSDCKLSTSTCSRVTPCRDFFIPQNEEVAIEKECSKDAIDKDPDPCLKVCEPYNCCFTDDECPDHVATDCHLYTPCKILLDNDNSGAEQSNPTEAKVDLNEFCKLSNLGSNWNACISHCERYECCFENRACDVTEQHCTENAFCAGFFDNNGGTSGTSAEKPFDPLELQSSASVEGTISEANLEEMCAPYEQLSDNWNACISYCEPYECCFTGSNVCDKSKTQCGDFSICAQFFAPSVPVVSNTGLEQLISSGSTAGPNEPEDMNRDDIQYTAVELAQACNSQQLSKDDSDCKKLCKGSACCFSSYPSSNCYERQTSFCHDHAICESVFDR